MVIGMSKPWKEDYEVEQEVVTGQKYGKKVGWTTIESTSEPDVVYIEAGQRSTTKIIVSDNEIIEYLSTRVFELEKQVESIQEQQKHIQLSNLREQNEISRRELETIFDIEPNDQVDTKTLDGLLKDYVNPNENSSELVRSVRDNS